VPCSHMLLAAMRSPPFTKPLYVNAGHNDIESRCSKLQRCHIASALARSPSWSPMSGPRLQQAANARSEKTQAHPLDARSPRESILTLRRRTSPRSQAANLHDPREVIQHFKGGNPHAPREAIPLIRGKSSGTSTRSTLSEGVYPHAQAEDMPTLRGSLANQHYPREVIQNFKGGNPHAPREAIPVIRGKSHRSEGGDPDAPRKAIRTIRGR